MNLRGQVKELEEALQSIEQQLATLRAEVDLTEHRGWPAFSSMIQKSASDRATSMMTNLLEGDLANLDTEQLLLSVGRARGLNEIRKLVANYQAEVKGKINVLENQKGKTARHLENLKRGL